MVSRETLQKMLFFNKTSPWQRLRHHGDPQTQQTQNPPETRSLSVEKLSFCRSIPWQRCSLFFHSPWGTSQCPCDENQVRILDENVSNLKVYSSWAASSLDNHHGQIPEFLASTSVYDFHLPNWDNWNIKQTVGRFRSFKAGFLSVMV